MIKGKEKLDKTYYDESLLSLTQVISTAPRSLLCMPSERESNFSCEGKKGTAICVLREKQQTVAAAPDDMAVLIDLELLIFL